MIALQVLQLRADVHSAAPSTLQKSDQQKLAFEAEQGCVIFDATGRYQNS